MMVLVVLGISRAWYSLIGSPTPVSGVSSFLSRGGAAPSSGFIQRVISLPRYNWVILSQKPRKGHRQHSSFLSPAKSISTSNIARVSPASYYQQFSKISLSPQSIASQQDRQSTFLPAEVFRSPSLFPNGVIFSYRYSCNYHLQQKKKSTLQHHPRSDFPAPVKDLLS